MKRLSHIFLLVLFVAGCDRSPRPGPGSADVFDQAVAALQQHDALRARRLFEQAAASYTQPGTEERQAITRTYLAQVHLELREFRAALSDIQAAALLYTKLGDARSGIRLAAIEGDVYAAAGLRRRAIERYQQAAEGASAFDDRSNAAAAEVGIARCLTVNGDVEAAAEHFRTAESRYESAVSAEGFASAALGEGRALRMLQKWPEALNAISQAEHAVDGLDRPALRALIQAEAALVRMSQGNSSAAVTGLRDAINTLRRQRTGRDIEPSLLGLLASVYERTGRVAEAMAFYLEGVEVAKQGGDRLSERLLQLASVRVRASAASDSPAVRQALVEQYRTLAQQFHDIGCGSAELFSYLQMGALAELNGALGEAQDDLSRAVTVDQRTMGEYFDADRHLPLVQALGIDVARSTCYAELARVLLRRDRAAEALRILEWSRVRQMSGAVSNTDLTIRQPFVRKSTEEVRNNVEECTLRQSELAARLTLREGGPDAAEANALRVEADKVLQGIRASAGIIVKAYPNYDLLVPAPAVDPASLQRYIPRGGTVLTFLTSEDRLYLFALTRTTLAVRTTRIRLDSLTAFVREYEQLLVDPRVYSSDAAAANVAAMTRFAELSTHLYDLLLKPAEDLFDRDVILIPTGLFAGLPFHALERQDNKGNVKYLIETMGVDYLPSISALRYQVQVPLRVQQVLAFGNPTGKNWSIDYELRDLRSFFHDARVMVGLETAWDNLRKSSADVLQLSTDYVNQSRTRPLGDIVLSNGLTVEGSVEVRFDKLTEMTGIPVMVLSNQAALGTGLGSLHAAVLRMNGTSDVFLTAWSADRRASKFFSEFFYTHLANGLAPGDAYRQALLNLIRTREVSHQHAWGQFFHYGIG